MCGGSLYVRLLLSPYNALLVCRTGLQIGRKRRKMETEWRTCIMVGVPVLMAGVPVLLEIPLLLARILVLMAGLHVYINGVLVLMSGLAVLMEYLYNGWLTCIS